MTSYGSARFEGRATFAFVYRFRVGIVVLICLLGFTAPWDLVLHLDSSGPNAHVWGLLSALLAKAGVMSIGAAFIALLVLAIASAVAGAALRTWASAYGNGDGTGGWEMRGDAVVADGPYRYMRHPRDVGMWANTFALALLMPVSGAIFAIGGVVVFQLWMERVEEGSLAARLGAAYAAYCARVPRVVPSLRSGVEAAGGRARWWRGVVAEIFMWGTAASFAVLGWRYQAELLLQCVLVWLGVALIVRGAGVKRG